MTNVQYMNVWRSTYPGSTHQWTDASCHGRDFCDGVADDVHAENTTIRRVGVLRVRVKEGGRG